MPVNVPHAYNSWWFIDAVVSIISNRNGVDQWSVGEKAFCVRFDRNRKFGRWNKHDSHNKNGSHYLFIDIEIALVYYTLFMDFMGNDSKEFLKLIEIALCDLWANIWEVQIKRTVFYSLTKTGYLNGLFNGVNASYSLHMNHHSYDNNH